MKEKIRWVITSLIGLGLVWAFVSCTSSGSNGDLFTMTILHTNDSTYDTFDIGGQEDYSLKSIGFPRLKTLFESYKKRGANILLLDGGDAFGGGAFPMLTEGKAIVDLFNYLQYDAMVVGNHEFDHGFAHLKELLTLAEYPIISANIVDKQTGELVFPPYLIKQYGDVRIGIFGLTTPETLYATAPVNVQNLEFLDVVETAKRYSDLLLQQEKVQFVIALGHLGTDASTAEKAQSYAVMESVPQVDLFVDGHSERVLPQGIEVTPGRYIVETGRNLQNLGVVTVRFRYLRNEQEEGAGLTIVPGSKRVSVRLLGAPWVTSQRTRADQGAQDIIDRYLQGIQEDFGQIVGHTDYLLEGERAAIRTRETNLGNLIADALRLQTQADVALAHSGGIRSSIDKGPIRFLDVYTAVPFHNRVLTMEVYGSDLLKALEHGVAHAPAAPNGAFLQVSGMKITYHSGRMIGKRILTVQVGDQALDVRKRYKVAIPDFIVQGGDGFTAFSGMKGVVKDVIYNVVVDHIREQGVGSLYASTQGRIVEVKNEFAVRSAGLSK